MQLSKPFWTEGEVQKAFMKEARENLAVLEAQLDGNKFFAGDSLRFLDIAACALAIWLDVMEESQGVRLVGDGEFPALCRWAKDYTSDEAVKKCVPDRDQLVAYFVTNRDKYKANANAMLKE
jgi:glutathione S-transferase